MHASLGNPIDGPARSVARRAACALVLALAALGTNFLFRGLVADDSTLAWEWADGFLGRRPLDPANVPEDFPPLFPILLHASFAVAGHGLVALHALPLAASILNPVLAFLLFRELLRSDRWAFAGAALFLLWPTGIFFFNQALAEPVTLSLVLAALLAHAKERIWLFLLLALASLLSAYDVALLLAGVALESLIGWRRSAFHRRLARVMLAVVVAGVAAYALDRHLLDLSVFPHDRLQQNVLDRLSRDAFAVQPVKVERIARYFFAYLLLPAAFVGAWIDLRRRRGIWPAFALGGYLFYEIAIRPYFLPSLGVTLRHLTLVIPSAALLSVQGIRAIVEAWPDRGRGARGVLLAYAVATFLAIAGVQLKYAYYTAAVQVATTPAGVLGSDPELPFHVESSDIDGTLATVVRWLDPLSGGSSWDERVLDLGAAVASEPAVRWPPGTAVDRIELVVLRGEVELARAWLEDGRSRIESTAVPLEAWRSISPMGRWEDRGDRGWALRTEAGYLSGAAYPLDGPFVSGGTGDRIGLVLRGSGAFVANVVVRLADGQRAILVFHPRTPAPRIPPEQLDRDVIRTSNDQIQWRALGFFRPEGLWTIGPLLDYDHLYYQNGASVQELPAGRMARRAEGDANLARAYVGPTAAGKVALVFESSYERPIAHLSVAAFVGHLVPGDRLEVELEGADGTWRSIGGSQGALQRRHWGAELPDPTGGGRTLRLRFVLEAADWLPAAVRSRIPMGLRDLAIGVRLAP